MKTKKRSLWLNTKGFGLAESLIAVVLAGLLVLGFFEVSKFSNVFSGSIDSKFGQLKLQSDLRQIVMHQKSCSGAFVSRQFSTSSSTPVILSFAGQTLGAGQPNNELRDYGVQIQSFHLTNPRFVSSMSATDLIYSARLEMEANATKGSSPLAPVTLGVLYFQINGGTIVDCLTAREEEKPETILCTTFGGTPLNGGCKLEPQTTSVMCADGQYLQGFTSGGTASCQTL